MRPQEVFKKLNITDDEIKKYKKAEIFTPENPPDGNRATNYTERDVENLRKLVVLGKFGLTCGNIKKLQDNQCSLEEILLERQKHMDEKINKMQNALKMMEVLLDDHAEFANFQTNHYWNVLNHKEESGEEFMDIEDMFDYQAVPFGREVVCPCCCYKANVDLEDFLCNESSYEKENGMGPDVVYEFDSDEFYECPNCSHVLRIEGWIREYPIGAFDSDDIKVTDTGMTKEEEELLNQMDAGELDGIVGDFLQTSGKSDVWMEIEGGIPRRFKQGPGGKFFNGKENERYEGVLHTLEEWKTDEKRLEFLRKYGWLMKDSAVKTYSAKFIEKYQSEKHK